MWLRVVAASAGVLALLPASASVGATSAPPTGGWEGTVVISRNGVARGQMRLILTIAALRPGRVSARADWRARPLCTDFLRLERARGRYWRFSIAATVGACLGRSWVYELTRLDARRLRLRARSPLPRFRGIVYRGTLVRMS